MRYLALDLTGGDLAHVAVIALSDVPSYVRNARGVVRLVPTSLVAQATSHQEQPSCN